jgi:hypothetical protein
MGKNGILASPSLTDRIVNGDAIISSDLDELIRKLSLGEIECIICSEDAINIEVEERLSKQGIKPKLNAGVREISIYFFVKTENTAMGDQITVISHDLCQDCDPALKSIYCCQGCPSATGIV